MSCSWETPWDTTGFWTWTTAVSPGNAEAIDDELGKHVSLSYLKIEAAEF